MKSENLRVIHIHLGIKGGAERFFVNLVNKLAERGVEQQALIFPDRIWKSDIEDVCTVHEFGFSRGHIQRFFTNRKIARIRKQFQPHAMMSWMGQATRWIPNDPSIVTAARLGDYPEIMDYFVNCDYLVCNTPDIAKTAKSLGWPAGQEKVISNFTNTKPVPAIDRQTLDTPKDAFVVLGMGRFVPRKGFDTLIRAMQAHKDAYLWLLGEGECEGELRALCQTLDMTDRVKFGGWVADPNPYLAACDTFCIPSRHEPLGNVVLESWASQRPIVSTASEGPSWLIKDNENGLLVDIDDHSALSLAIGRLQESSDFRQKLVQNGEKSLQAGFTSDKIADAYIELLSEKMR